MLSLTDLNEKALEITKEQPLKYIQWLVHNDKYASSFQSTEQYRRDLLEKIEELIDFDRQEKN